MANTALKKVSVRLKLENGTDDYGNPKYVNLSLGSLSRDNFDADKALAVKAVLAPCLSKTVGIVEMTQVSEITAA